jgi:hypothetical protein
VVCYFSYHFLNNFFAVRTLVAKIIEAFAPIILGGVTFIVAAKLLGVSELEKLFKIFSRRLGLNR